MNQDLLHELAKKGAEAELVLLRVRVKELEKIISGGAPVTRKRSTMSAAKRKAVSQRMKQYWAAKRKGNKKAPATKG